MTYSAADMSTVLISALVPDSASWVQASGLVASILEEKRNDAMWRYVRCSEASNCCPVICVGPEILYKIRSWIHVKPEYLIER
jgi:hypothetical protein